MSGLNGLCAGGVYLPADGPCPECGALPNQTCGKWVREAQKVIVAVKAYSDVLAEFDGDMKACGEHHEAMLSAFDKFVKEGCQP